MRPKQLFQLLSFSISNQLPVLITGSPGVGKTEIVRAACAAAKHDMLIMHPVVSEPTDFKGLPFAVNGNAEFLPYGYLRQMLEATQPLVVFLDDLGQADASVQKALMQLLLERRINGQKISDKVVFISATNKQEHKAGVSSILEPVKSRFATIVELEVNLDDWVEWAIANNMPADLISFLRFKPHTLSNWKPTREIENSPSPRTISRVGHFMNLNLPVEMEMDVYSGAAGKAFATELLAFLNLSRKLPSPTEILKNPKKAKLPKELSEKYAISGALAYAVGVNTFSNMITYLKRLQAPEFEVLALRDSMVLKGKDLVQHKSYMDWVKDPKNKSLLFA